MTVRRACVNVALACAFLLLLAAFCGLMGLLGTWGQMTKMP